MKIFDNGIYRDATLEELAEWAAEAEKLAALLAAIEGGIKDA